METYIKLSDAIKAYCEHQCVKGMIRGECGCDECGTIFDDIPTVQLTVEDKVSEPPAQPKIIRCYNCKYYEGVHGTPGHAPCSFWNSGGVLWNDFCSNAQQY